MDLAEYFRIPASQRLSRVDIAMHLNELNETYHLGRSITPVAVGLWVSSNKVPDWWIPLVEKVLNSAVHVGPTPKIVLSLDHD